MSDRAITFVNRFSPNKLIWVGLAIILSIHLTASFAEAAAGPGHVPSIADLKWFWINFLLFVGLMYIVVRKPVSQAWSARRSEIFKAVEAGKIQLVTAQHALGDAKRQLETVHQEVARITSTIEVEAKTEAAQIVEDARKRAERILAQAAESAQAEQKAAAQQIRRELVQTVLDKAEQKIKNEFNAGQDKSLRDAAIGSLKGLVQ